MDSTSNTSQVEDISGGTDPDVTIGCSLCHSTYLSNFGRLNDSNEFVCRNCSRGISSDDADTFLDTMYRQVFSSRDPDLVEQENENLLDDILKSLADPEFEYPEVILFLGSPGAGKSAIINTIQKSLSGKYLNIARPGAGSAQTITTDVNWLMNCGVRLHDIEDPGRRERFTSLVKKLPHLLDVAGFSDEGKHKKLLELLIGGYIPPDTYIPALQEMDEKRLCLKFNKSRSEWKVTKICFVQSIKIGSSGIPHDLIRCLQSVLSIVDPTTYRRKYTAGVFLIFSKWDLVQYPNKRNLFAHDDSQLQEISISAKDAMKNHDVLLAQFNMVGAREHTSRQWSSFMSDTGYDNVFIENNALKFLKLLVEHRRRKPQPPPPPPDCLSKLKVLLFDVWQFIKLIVRQVRVFGFVAISIVFLAILIILLTKDV